MNQQLLSVKNLRAWYHLENPVLSDFSIDLNTHEVVGLIGLNELGKRPFLKSFLVCWIAFRPMVFG